MRRSDPSSREPAGFTVIELIVVLLIGVLMITVAAAAWGSVVGARTKEGAAKVATAVRYAYNLAAINNKVYALYINLDEGTYYAGPLDVSGECDRVLIALDGRDTDPLLVKLSDTGEEKKKERERDRDAEPGLFDAAMSGAGGGGGEPTLPSWAFGDPGPSNKLMKMVSEEAYDSGRNETRNAGVSLDAVEAEEGEKQEKAARTRQKTGKSFRRNQLSKPKKLPEGVRFGGVVVRDGADPVTEGVVPILFYPHGFTQRALIYVESGDEEDPDTFTVEVMSLQGRGKVHAVELDVSEFKEQTE